MQIPFDQFEQNINETILKRGLSYFKNDRVQPPEELSPGYYEAVVEGSENYVVRLNIQNEVITDHSCTCPYDFGPICKHVVALLFYLQQETLDIQPLISRTRKQAKKQKTVSEQLDEILAEVPVDTLIHYLKDQALNDPSFRRSFIAAFAHYGKAESKSIYAQQLRAVISSAKQRQGYIDYRSVFKVGKAAQDLLESASGHIVEGNFQSAFYISTAVLEEMNKALNFSDDSNGDIGDAIHGSLNILFELASHDLPDDIKKVIFEYAVKAFNKQIFAGWDWHVDMLELASSLGISEKEVNKLLKIIDTYNGTEYDEKDLRKIKYKLLQIIGSPDAQNFLEQNIKDPSLREMAIEKAFESKDYETAITIAEDGINCDAEDKPGYVYDWYNWLLKIYIDLGDESKIIEISRFLYLNAHAQNEWYFNLLKNYIAKEKWKDFLEELVVELRQRNSWSDVNKLENIFISEKDWVRLLELLKANLTLERITEYENYLKVNYSDVLLSLYNERIIEYLSNNTGRSYYKDACRYIKQIIKLGGKEEVDQLINYLKNEYPARRALREELDRL